MGRAAAGRPIGLGLRNTFVCNRISYEWIERFAARSAPPARIGDTVSVSALSLSIPGSCVVALLRHASLCRAWAARRARCMGEFLTMRV
mmetsp:Transcript_15310/g.41269  ORF Transcript_15310/g.41269 Transcript_15310/m.41269 type:complete len:89 (+) Transcript_15310:368-634(+)